MIIQKLQLIILIAATTCVAAERWSRQISNAGLLPDAINDWIPLAQPCPTCQTNDRSGNGRVLSFPPQNQFQQNAFGQGVIGPAASNQVLSIGQPFQFHRFAAPLQQQQQPQKQQLVQQPTSQSFFKFEMPAYQDGVRQDNLPTVQTGYQIQHSPPHQSVVNSPLFSQKQVFPAEFHPRFQQQHQKFAQQQKNIKQNIIENGKQELKDNRPLQSKPSQLQEQLSIPPPAHFSSQPNFQALEATSFQPQNPFQADIPFQPQQQSPQDEEVQLLYVPYDTLYQQRGEPLGFNNNKYSVIPPPINPVHINNFYTPEPLSIPTTTTTTTTIRPSTYHQPLNHLRFSTPKPRPRPHQPPLAMFVVQKNDNYPEESVNEVLTSLKSANSIAVLDTPQTKKAPPVFIGPAGLPPPNGYTKFELPYLSNIDPNQMKSRINDIPFFVAPLSYKAPSGFAKIPLPEPHVGSIVVNQPTEKSQIQQTQRPVHAAQNMYITPITDRTPFYASSTPRIPSSSPITHSFSITDQRGATPTTKNFFQEQYQHDVSPVTTTTRNVFRDQYQQNSVTSVRPPPFRTSQPDNGRNHFQKRPEEHHRPYASFKPMPNHVVNEEYFTRRPQQLTSSTASTTATIATESEEQFIDNSHSTEQVVEIQPSRGHTYNDITSSTPEVTHTRYHHTSPRPVQYSTKAQEEHRMKNFYREQDAIRNRPTFHSTTPAFHSTTPSPRFENVQYTPVSVDYDNQLYNIPSSTPSYFEGSTLRTSTVRDRVTFYTPNPHQEEEPASNEKPSENAIKYSSPSSAEEEDHSQYPETTTTTRYHSSTSQIPGNHRPSYNNEIVNEDQSLEYDPNPYKLPSELPPLTPNLPGLVNALIERERLEKGGTTEALTTTTPTTLRPTRRPITRSRKPAVSKTVSYSSSSSSSSSAGSVDSTTKRTVIRSRRPYVQRPVASTNQTYSTTTRTPPVRNPNKIRYRPTAEERQQFRLRTKSSGKGHKEEDNLDYQRDVLKQNYPVFRPNSKVTTTSTTEKLEHSEDPQAESTSEDRFTGLLEPMQIAQEYQHVAKDNYGPGYFPNEEETTNIPANRNEIHPVYTTASTTTTTQAPVREVTRRPTFVRRASRPTRTTTETPITTTNSPEERHTVRTRTRTDNGSQRPKIVKIRGRTRKPHPASTTIKSGSKDKDSGYNQVNRFNQDFYQDNHRTEGTYKRSKYNLEAQESQWSPSLSHGESFQPIDPKSKLQRDSKFENEPEIVTAGPDQSEVRKSDTFLFNVSAGFGPSVNTFDSVEKIEPSHKEGRKMKSNSETNFADMIEEVMSGIKRDFKTDQSSTSAESSEGKPKRRGVWKRVRVHQTDSFETAESQNLGNQLLNSFYNGQAQKNDESKTISKEEITTETPQEESITTTENEDLITTIASDNAGTESAQSVNATSFPEPKQLTTVLSSVETAEPVSTYLETPEPVSTAEPKEMEEQPSETTTTFLPEDFQVETTTDLIDQRIYDGDDLETQPSLFDEVRKQLNNLFAAEEDPDQDDVVKPNFRPRKQEYTSIQRIRAVSESSSQERNADQEEISPQLKPTVAPTEKATTTEVSPFHKNLMGSVVYATSTSTEVSHETEICYRGRCIKTTKPV